jgi:hypothetical protein
VVSNAPCNMLLKKGLLCFSKLQLCFYLILPLTYSAKRNENNCLKCNDILSEILHMLGTLLFYEFNAFT